MRVFGCLCVYMLLLSIVITTFDGKLFRLIGCGVENIKQAS